jgi:hypothetical protein
VWGEGTAEVFTRLNVDIAHLNLGQVPQLRAASSLVSIAKHICGSASDVRRFSRAVFVLCCFLLSVRISSSSSSSCVVLLLCQLTIRCSATTLGQHDDKLVGMAVALCCHHRCTYGAYLSTTPPPCSPLFV